MSELVLCEGCWRHYRLTERACPFCGATGARRIAAHTRFGSKSASRARRYRLSAALVAGAAAIACGKTRSSELDASAGDSSIDDSMNQGGTATGGVFTSGGALGMGGATSSSGGAAASGGRPPGIIVAPTGGRPEPSGAVAGSGVVPTGRNCEGFADRIGCRTEFDCPLPKEGYYTQCQWEASVLDSCGNPRQRALSLCEPPCEAGESCLVDGICGYSRCRRPCPEEPCDDTESCDENGRCVARPCEAENGTVCPGRMVCDPDTRLSAHHCVLPPCDDRADCLGWQSCGGTTTMDGLGCAALPCERDEDCGNCGYCVETRCLPMLGFCNEQMILLPYGCVWPDEEWV